MKLVPISPARILATAFFASGLVLLGTAALAGDGPSPALAEEPQITFQFPEEGDVIKEPPFVLHMCFEAPVNVKDLDQGGDFRFRLLRPDDKGLGMRIVFQPDGYGVAIYPGLPTEPIPEGEWTWDYRLTDNVTLEAAEGTVHFEVNAQTGKEIISATPPACVAEGATAAPTFIAASPGAGTAGPSATPDHGEDPGDEEDDDGGPDILLLSLLTIGAAGVAAIIAVIGYLIRRRVKYFPHAPEEGQEPPAHH